MARDGRDDERDEAARGEDRGLGHGVTAREPQPPPREIRQRVRGGRGLDYRVRGSEWQLLETVGTFRVVAERDLDGLGRETAVTRSDLRHLAHSWLIERKTAVVNHAPTRLVVLTSAGKDLLDRHREARSGPAAQQYYAGFVKPRELAHDVQVYRAYRAERARMEADGGRVTRVVLD